MRTVSVEAETPHEFVSGSGCVFCRWCGYVCYVEDSIYDRNNKRQAEIPKLCVKRNVQAEVSP